MPNVWIDGLNLCIGVKLIETFIICGTCFTTGPSFSVSPSRPKLTSQGDSLSISNFILSINPGCSFNQSPTVSWTKLPDMYPASE